MDGSGFYVVLLVRARRLRRVGVWIAAVGARSVEDNLGGFVLGLGNAAQQKVADVGDDGGAARRDAILRSEDEEAREDVIDVVGSIKFGHLADESGAEVGEFALLELPGMVGAKAGARIGNWKAAAAARRKTVLTAR